MGSPLAGFRMFLMDDNMQFPSFHPRLYRIGARAQPSGHHQNQR